MKISRNCIELVAGFEGLQFDAYLDPVGIPTIGYGTIRYPDGSRVRLGDRISEDDAESLLTLECQQVAAEIERLAKGITLTQNQFDALVSFTYNVGIGALSTSTLFERLKQGNFAAAANEFKRWNKGTVNGEKRILPGLTIRRQTEGALFANTTDEGEPIPVEESPQDKATLLIGFREGDLHVIVAKDAEGNPVDMIELDSTDIDALSALLRTYPNAIKFQIATADETIPAGERTKFVLRDRLIARPKRRPKLDQPLLVRGNSDRETGHNDVEEMQRQLRDLGFYQGKIDGIFGRGTDDAVRQFQARVFGRAEADGKVGPITWNKLFGEEEPQRPDRESPAREGFNYLRLTKTNQRDDKGLVVLDLAYYRDGRLQDRIPACSGVRSRQNFRTGPESVSGSKEPLPEGRWTISDVKWADGRDNFDGRVWSNSLGPAKIFLCYKGPGTTRRNFVEIHMDWNRRTGPGTAGCIGIHSVSDFKRLVGWLRDTDPRSLYVDWGLGTCPEPKAPAATSREGPCVW